MIRTLAGLVPPWAYATAQQWFSDCVKFGLVTDDELVAHIDKLMPGRALSVRWSGTNAERVATVLAGKETSFECLFHFHGNLRPLAMHYARQYANDGKAEAGKETS